MTKLKAGVIGAVLLGVAALVAFQQQSLTKLRSENISLRQQLEESAQLAAENEQLSNSLAQARAGGSEAQTGELLKLRGEVGLLRRQTNELGMLRQQNGRLKEALARAASAEQQARTGNTGVPQEDPGVQQERAAGIARMNDAKYLMLGSLLFSQEHQGQLPATVEEAKRYLDANTGLTQTNEFELIYQGPLRNVTNPATTIVVREKQAHQTMSGTWVRAYGFADGHSEYHVAADGNFEPWERQRMISPVPGSQPGP